MKKYNDEKRLNAKLLAEKDNRAEKWAKASLENNFKDVPLKLNPSLRYKAMESSAQQEAMAEVEILQKIIVREGLLAELHKLLKSQNDVSSCLNEVGEIVKALRYQTLDIVEDISAWQDVQSVPRPFLFKGLNYLVKIKGDLDFLDLYEEVTEKFCFEFRSNPLAYRDGGNIITGYAFDQTTYNAAMLKKTSNQSFVDGIDIFRLRNAEKIIQNEFIRLGAERNAGGTNGGDGKGDAGNREGATKEGRDFESKIETGGAMKRKLAKKVKGRKATGAAAAATAAAAAREAEGGDMRYYYEKPVKKSFNPRQ